MDYSDYDINYDRLQINNYYNNIIMKSLTTSIRGSNDILKNQPAPANDVKTAYLVKA